MLGSSLKLRAAASLPFSLPLRLDAAVNSASDTVRRQEGGGEGQKWDFHEKERFRAW